MAGEPRTMPEWWNAQNEARQREPSATVRRGLLLVELAAREAGRREHRTWRKASAKTLLAVLDELGVKLVTADVEVPDGR